VRLKWYKNRDVSQSEDSEATLLGEEESPKTNVLDHPGLVAGTFEEVEIGDRIDERKVSVGQAVKAMVPGRLRVCPAAALPDATVF
jgi:hypothetical protein